MHTDSNRATALGVLTKYWASGMVKTRLTPAIGSVAAADVHRALVAYTLRTLADAADTRCVAVAAGATKPEFALARVARVAGNRWGVTEQAEGTLGTRIARLMRFLMRDSRRVIIIGTDCPRLSRPLIDAALQRLLSEKMVLGPASDGGYYLIGLRGPWRDSMEGLFSNIDWGTERVAAQTIAAAAALGYSVAPLEMLADLDRPEDLPHFVRSLEEGQGDRQLQIEIQQALRTWQRT